jgi:hypothetical protein
MPLTKVTQGMIKGSAVNAVDYMTDAQVAQAQAGTLSNADAVAVVQLGVDAVRAVGGGTVYVPQGCYMGALFYNLNLYRSTNPVIPVIVVDQSRSDHLNYYVNSNDVEMMWMGGAPLTGGPNSPVIRIHNYSLDGLRNPGLFYSYGPTPDSGSNTTLGWAVFGSNDGNAHSNVPAHDYVIAGGQGAQYTVGTVSVVAGSKTVTGVATGWTSDFIGAILTLDAQVNAAGIVASVESATSLTLVSTWGTYNGVTEAAGTYLLRGGLWYGTQTSDYRGRLVLGQNYTWLFNTGNFSGGEDYDPLAVANGTGNYPANISYVFNGNRLRNGSLNPSTLLKLDNPSGSDGLVGFILTSGADAGPPTKTIYLNKSTSDDLIIGNDLTPANFIAKFSDTGVTHLRTASVIGAGGSVAAITLTPYALNGIITYSIAGNATFNVPDSATVLVGQELTFILTQSGGANTLTFAAGYKLAGSAFTLTSANGKVDVITFIATSTSTFVEKSRAQNQ